ncbi:MAG: imidazole glycerol phosphate synthase subunit HisH [Methylococcaceae bacterium]|nr:MAG: imidazole glycerol phosphate synthase subunit HisH [Methylococcaceae bacterium]
MTTVAVVDYGMGNLHSIAKALAKVAPGADIRITHEKSLIAAADRVVFPGVGAMRDCMRALHELDLHEPLRRAAAEKPFLGICLGMQALLESSEENGGTLGLGLLPGRVVRFAENLHDAHGEPLKIPHMGWNQVHQLAAHPLWQGIAQDSRFYFVHSYYAQPAEAALVNATSDYPAPFACVLARDNVFAVQFHPEKSQQVGLRLLENFLGWNGAC